MADCYNHPWTTGTETHILALILMNEEVSYTPNNSDHVCIQTTVLLLKLSMKIQDIINNVIIKADFNEMRDMLDNRLGHSYTSERS